MIPQLISRHLTRRLSPKPLRNSRYRAARPCSVEAGGSCHAIAWLLLPSWFTFGAYPRGLLSGVLSPSCGSRRHVDSFDKLDELSWIDDSCSPLLRVGRFEKQVAHLFGPKVGINLPAKSQHAGTIWNRPAQTAPAVILIAEIAFVTLLGSCPR